MAKSKLTRIEEQANEKRIRVNQARMDGKTIAHIQHTEYLYILIMGLAQEIRDLKRSVGVVKGE